MFFCLGNPLLFPYHHATPSYKQLPIPTAVDISPNAGQRIPLSYDDDDDRFGDMHVT